MSVTFEVNLDRRTVERTIYSILDWVGDVGGLSSGLFNILKIAAILL